MTWLPETAAGADPFERAFGLRPNLFEAWRAFEAGLWRAEGVDPELLALCRLCLARANGASRVPGSPGPALDPERAAALDAWRTSDRFSPFEKACLRFAEQFAADPGGIGDDLARPVVEALGDAGTVAFVEALAIFDGFTRFCTMLDLAADAPAGGAP
jgi:alkylhydroperoxidase family enzyme